MLRTLATYLIALMVFVVGFWVIKVAFFATFAGLIGSALGAVMGVVLLGLGALVVIKVGTKFVTGKAR